VPKPEETGILAGVDLDAYAGNHRAAALREAQRLAVVQSQELDEAEFVTYGHIAVDEAQDLSPMELRVLKRRDLTGSMTIVGDMGQATTASSASSWDALLGVLAPRRTPKRVDLTVSYRTPEEVLNFAAATLVAAAPGPGASAARSPGGGRSHSLRTCVPKSSPKALSDVHARRDRGRRAGARRSDRRWRARR